MRKILLYLNEKATCPFRRGGCMRNCLSTKRITTVCMRLEKYIIGCICAIFLSLGAYSQEILIDGRVKTLSNFSCGEMHTLRLSDPSTWSLTFPAPYCLWQRSDNDGASWQNILESGSEVYSLNVVNHDGTKQLYRAIIADSESDATSYALSGNATGQSVLVSDEVSIQCDLTICDEKENRLVVWMEDFKSVPRGERRECDNLVGLKFAGKYNSSGSTNIGDGKYGVVSHSADGSIPSYNWFSGGTDHTGNKDGGFLIINNVDGGAPDVLLYEKTIDFDLCPDTWYYFSLYAMCISGGAIGDPDDSFAHCNFTFEIIGEDGVTVLALDKSGDVPLSNYGISSWYNYGVSFNSGNNKNVILRIYDSAKKNMWGNDMAVDDISLIACEKPIPETTLGVGLEKDKEGVCGDVTQLSLSDMSPWESELPNVYCTWQTSDDGGFTWTTMQESGEKVYSVEVPFQKSVEGIRYRVIVSKDQASGQFIAEHGYSDDACHIYKISNVSTLTCHCETPELSISPADPSFCTDSITLSAKVENAAPVDSFVWSCQDVSTGDWVAIADQQGPSISVFDQIERKYCVVAWNDTCHSDTLFVTVPVKSPSVMKVNIDGAQTVCENGSATLKLTGVTGDNITWKKMEEGETGFSDISGSDAPDITVSPKKKTSYCAFSGILPGQCVQVFSDTVSVAVEDSVRFTLEASSNTICAGGNFSLKISSSQSSLTYTWEAKGDDEASFSAITPTTATELSLQPTRSTTYQVTGKSSVCPDVSHSFHVVVDNLATLGLTSSTDVVCVNGEVSLTADYGTASSIVWEEKAEGASDFSEFATDLATQKTVHPSGKTSYRIRSTQGGTCPESVSDVITIDTEDSLKVSIAAVEPVVCAGTDVSLQATVDGTPESVKWEKMVGGQTSLLANALTASDAPTQVSEYTVTASGKHCPSVSQSVSVAVDVEAVLSLSASDDVVCVNGEVSLTADYGTASSIVWEEKAEGASNFSEFATDLTTQKVVHPSGKTSYRIRSTQGGACPESVSDVITIDTEDSLKVSIAAVEPVVCAGTDVSLQATVDGTPESVKWEKMVGGQTSLLANALTASDAPTQVSEYTVTASGKHCPSVSQSVSVAVDVEAVLSLSASDDVVCVNGEVSLTADYGTASSIVWEEKAEGASNFSEFATDLTTQKVVHPSGKTSYRIRSTQGGACPESVSDVITIDTEDSLKVTIAAVEPVVCAGTDVSLQATVDGTPESVKWEKMVGGQTSLLANALTASDAPTQVSEYTVTASGKHCPSVSQSVSVAVDVEAVLSLSASDDVVCVNGEVSLTANYGTATAIVWEEKAEGASSFSEFATNLTTQKLVHPAGKTSYRIRSTQGGACPESVSDVITIDTEDSLRMTVRPILESLDEEYNVHLKATILQGTPTSFTWEKETALGRSVMSTQYEAIDTLYRKTTYIATAHAAHCPDVILSQTITINSVDVIDTICKGEVVTFNTPLVEENMAWEKQEAGASGFTKFSDAAASVEVSPQVTTTYRIRYEDFYSNLFIVYVEKPVEIEFTGDESACKGSDYTVSFHVKDGQDVTSLTLYETIGGNIINREKVEGYTSGDYNGSSLYTLQEETTFSLKATSQHCPEKEVSYTVKIDTVPTLYELTASSDSICRGDYVELSTDFPFSLNNLLLSEEYEGESSHSESSYMTSETERFHPEGTVRYTLVPRTENGCLGEERSVTVQVFDPGSSTTQDTSVCMGDRAFLRVVGGELEEKYVWSTSPDYSDIIATGNRQVVLPEETTTYYVKAMNGKCERTMEQTIYVLQKPSILVNQEDAQTIVLEGVGGSGDYWFDLGSGFERTNTMHNVTPNWTYTVKVKDDAGCMNDTTFVSLFYDLFIPEYFTPQGDGSNDTWKIVNLEYYANVRVSIFDRHGKKIFESTDPEQEWDGTYNGHALPSEDYWYVVNIYDIRAIFTGHFTLIR